MADLRHKVVADVGCGGGIYLRPLASLPQAKVIGLDFSEVSLASARAYCLGIPNIELVNASAVATGLRAGSVDLVVERALIHHFRSLTENFLEIVRVLRSGGLFWIQDRTVDDVLLEPSDSNIRAYYLQYFPHVRDIEIARRWSDDDVRSYLSQAGFTDIRSMKIFETRKVFESFQDLREEIVSRRGRSILHALDDDELSWLAEKIGCQIKSWPVRERDRWTVWLAKSP